MHGGVGFPRFGDSGKESQLVCCSSFQRSISHNPTDHWRTDQTGRGPNNSQAINVLSITFCTSTLLLYIYMRCVEIQVNT